MTGTAASLSERLKQNRRPVELGGALIRFPARPPASSCTCPPCWGGLCPPPACPVHGQTEMIQVRC